MEMERKSTGRYRLNEEDKAKPVPLKLHTEYIDRLEYMPGKTTAEKIRNLIDRSAGWSQREARQVKEIQRLIKPLYKVGKGLFQPELISNKDSYNREKNRFFDGLKALEAVLDILHFDIGSLKNLLSERDLIELEIIFEVKRSLRD